MDGPQAQYAAQLLPSFLQKNSQGDQRNHFKFPHYISILLDLLPGLPQEHAENLFENFDYDFQEVRSFLALFERDHSYDIWKEKAVEEAHKKVRQKRAEDRFGGFDYLYFLLSASAVGLVFPGNRQPNQNRIDFFVKEIVWAMDVYQPEGRIIDSEVDFVDICDRLPEILRRNFIKRHISMLSAQNVKKLTEIFPDYTEIATHLEKLRSEEEKEMSDVPGSLIREVELELNYRVRREKEKAEEKRIIDSMKKQKPR